MSARPPRWTPTQDVPNAGLLEEISDWAVGTDEEGRVAFVNRAARQALGAGVESLVGKPISELADPAERVGLHEALTRALLGEEGTPAPVSATLRAGEARVPVSGVVQAVRWRGETVGAVMLVKPAAEREDARLQASFVSLLGHELRTPLTTLRGALGLMTGAKVDGASGRAELVRLALNGAERLQALVEDWLDLADADSGRLTLARTRVPVADVVSASMQCVRAAAELRQVRLGADVQTARALWADGPRVVRVLGHLLDNAVTAAPASSVVLVTATDAPGGGVRLSVYDEGRGIRAAELEQAFGPFVRLDRPGWQRAGGLGVGLALCRAIVEQHGGRVGAESAPGRTVVWCELPTAE